MHLGKRQLAMLAALGSPGAMLIVPDKISLSLEKRGLLAARGGPPPKNREHAGFQSITPAGLRALADALEAGDIPIPDPQRKQAD